MSEPPSSSPAVEALAEEFLERRRQGQRPTVAEYLERHPNLADEIRAFFPALELIEEFKPQNEFKLHDWIPIHIGGLNLSINRAVFYLVLACILTSVTMIWIARRMQDRPNKTQIAVEGVYDLVRGQITNDNLDAKMAAKYFPFLATLFFFILFSNFIGLIPLPTNTEHPVDILGLEVPSFALYAATAAGVRGGDYYGPGRMLEMVGPPRPARSTPASRNPETAARLWEVSEQLTGVSFGI